MNIKQGDAYSLPVTVTVNGEAISTDVIDTAEFCIGGVRKLYPKEVTYSADDGLFMLPLTQSDTFSFEENNAVPLDIRVKLIGGAVIGTRIMMYLPVFEAISEEII